MTYAAYETSVQDGAPVEIYDFARNSKVWRFTSSESDETVSGNTYTASPIKRSEIETTPEKVRNNLTIDCARDFAIADLFRLIPKTDTISVTIRRYHRDDGTLATIWKGAVLNAKWTGAKAQLQCEPVSTSLGRNGLQRLCQKNCNWVLFGSGCELDKADFQTDTTVSSVSGVTVQVAALGSYPYGGGWIQKVDGDGNYERRFIESASGTTLTLKEPFESLSVSDSVSVFPGCDHTMDTCSGTYNNILNYGGPAPFMPLLNPFSGDLIF